MVIPTFEGKEKRRELYRQYGPPNTAPRPGESHFKRCRVLFVDDEQDGKPVAYWIPTPDQDVP